MFSPSDDYSSSNGNLHSYPRDVILLTSLNTNPPTLEPLAAGVTDPAVLNRNSRSGSMAFRAIGLENGSVQLLKP